MTSLTLINADTNQPIAGVGYDPLVSGVTLNLSQLPTRNLNIRANVTGTVGSVQFTLNATPIVTDNAAPYAFAGDNGATPPDYNAWTPFLGSQTLTVRAWTMANGSGTGGVPLTIQFTVTDAPPITGYRLRIYNPAAGTPPDELTVSTGTVQCNQPDTPPPSSTPVNNPAKWSWDDPLNVGRDCVYTDPRLDALADGSYEGAVAFVNSIGVGAESPHVPFVRSRPQVPSAPTGVLLTP